MRERLGGGTCLIKDCLCPLECRTCQGGNQKGDLGLVSGKHCGCKSMVRVHCKRKPLHSSAEPVKGAGLAMGLAKTIGEEVLGVVLG